MAAHQRASAHKPAATHSTPAAVPATGSSQNQPGADHAARSAADTGARPSSGSSDTLLLVVVLGLAALAVVGGGVARLLRRQHAGSDGRRLIGSLALPSWQSPRRPHLGIAGHREELTIVGIAVVISVALGLVVSRL